MSCFLSSADCINALATYWDTMANRDRFNTAEQSLVRATFAANRAHDGSDDFSEATTAARLLIRQESGSTWSAAFSLLLWANVRSVEARYPGDSEMSETGPEYHDAEPLQIVKYWIQTKQTGKIVGILNSFEYQSDNCPDWQESTAFQLCEQIRRFLLSEMLESAGDETNLSASFEAPEDPRETAMIAVLSKVNSRAVA